MTKKNYRCEECGAAVYLSMIHCDQCGEPLYLDPHRLVCNLAVVTMETEKLPMPEREYRLQYGTPFNTLEDLLKERHKYDDLGQKQKESLIYGKHLVYVEYRLNSLKKGYLMIKSAYHFVQVGVRWEWFKNYPVYYFVAIKDFPSYIKIVD